MEIRDFEKKMKYAMDFYDQATEIQHMVHDSIRGFHYLYGYDLYNEREVSNPELASLVERRKRQLLIEMGRVGEYSIKYLLLMEQMIRYPNQDIEEFTNKFIYSIGDKGVRNTYINQYHLDPNLVDEILVAKEQHSLQPLHDYSYLFTVLEKLFPNVVNHIQKNILYNIKGNNIFERKFLSEDKASLASFFASLPFLESAELSEEQNKEYISEYRENIEKSGDVFTKLRYFEHNMDNKQYDMNWVLYLMDQLVDYIVLTHEYNKDDPEKSVEVAYIKKKVSEHILPQGLRKYDEKFIIPKFGEELVAARILNANALETLDKYPELLDSIDYSQIAIWNRFNEEDIDFNRAISNFINNLVNFNHDPNILLNHYPLLLPTKHIIEVNKFLGDIGIDIDSVSKEESSILCVPIEYLKRGYERSDKSDVSVKSLINGINNALYDDGVSNGSKPEVPLRHR